MGGQGQRNKRRADALGRQTGHNRNGNTIGDRPNLAGTRGLPDYTHHEQASEPGVAVPSGHEVPVTDATHGHSDSLYETLKRTDRHRPPKPGHQSPITREKNLGMYCRQWL